MFYIDPLYMFILIVSLVVTGGAQLMVSNNFKKYGKIRNKEGLTGAQAGHLIAQQTGLDNIKFEQVTGKLTDHYDPKSNTVRLSPDVANKDSIAAVAITAHELGHAQQYKVGSSLIKARSFLIPAVTLSPQIAYVLIMMGLIFQLPGLFNLGIIFYALVVFFSLLTIPVEFDASKRALKTIEENKILDSTELEGANKVLKSAGLTYVAAGVSSLLQLLYYLSVSRRR